MVVDAYILTQCEMELVQTIRFVFPERPHKRTAPDRHAAISCVNEARN